MLSFHGCVVDTLAERHAIVNAKWTNVAKVVQIVYVLGQLAVYKPVVTRWPQACRPVTNDKEQYLRMGKVF